MKILVVTLSLSRDAGGLFNSVRFLSKYTSQVPNVEVTVVGVKDKNFEADIPAWGDANVIAFDRQLSNFKFGFSLGLLKFLMASKPDIIHLHGIWNFASLVVLIKSLFSSVKIIVSPRGMLDIWILEKNAFLKKIYWTVFESRLLKRSSKVHALNESEREAILQVLPSVEVYVSPNGVEKNLDENMEHKHSKKVVFIGRIDSKKGILELLDAWHRIENKHGWTLDIYGWGSDDYVSKVESYLVKSRDSTIQFLGPIYGDKKKKAMLDAGAFILPSYSEGLPMSILEAWNYSLPVMMTRECNLPEAFTLGAAKEIFIKNLSEDIQDFFSLSDEERKKIGNNAFELVNSKFLWDEIGRDTAHIYSEVAGE